MKEDRFIRIPCEDLKRNSSFGQSVCHYTAPPRAHPSAGSPSGSLAPLPSPGLAQVPSVHMRHVHVLAPGGYSSIASEVVPSRSVQGVSSARVVCRYRPRFRRARVRKRETLTRLR